MNKYIKDTTVAILGAVIVTVVSLFVLGPDAKDIALAIGGGLVGYLAKGEED